MYNSRSLGIVSFLVALLLTTPVVSFAEDSLDCGNERFADTVYYSRFETIVFDCDELAHKGVNPESGNDFEETHEYEIEYRSGLAFVRLTNSRNHHWLALTGGDLLFLYDGEGEPAFFRGVTESPNRLEAQFGGPRHFSASSFLTEGDIEYSPDNLDWHWTRKPWVEGVPGQGIGEEIHIDRWFGRLWISIGFVSYDRPELYELNSRPKTIRVVSEATGEERVVELEDTPNLQPIDVPGDWETASEGGIRIIIEEVYPGTRWEDTAVNFIVFF